MKNEQLPVDKTQSLASTCHDLNIRLRELEEQLELVRGRTRKSSASKVRGIGLGIAGTLGVVLLLEGGMTFAQSSACGQTLPDPMVTFCANTPAVASDMNDNFQWVVDKIGAGVSGVQSTNLSLSGEVMSELRAAFGIRVRKNGNTSTINFDARVNDPGAIVHHEDNNSGELWLSSSDDWDAGATNDRIVFGEYPNFPRFEVKANGDARVYRNLTVDGNFRGWSVTGPIHRTSRGSIPLNVSRSEGICFLTQIYFDHRNCDPGRMVCTVSVNSSGNWILTNQETSSCSTDANCSAHCLRF